MGQKANKKNYEREFNKTMNSLPLLTEEEKEYLLNEIKRTRAEIKECFMKESAATGGQDNSCKTLLGSTKAPEIIFVNGKEK